MAKQSKEQQLYLQAMEHALKVAKDKGVEELEKEVRYRSAHPVPLNVNHQELKELVRECFEIEFRVVATAMTMTLTDCIKMPPTMIMDYLKYFNNMVEVYRTDNKRYEADVDKLNSDFKMNEIIKLYLREDKDNE